jgi:hypothetical protein
MYGQMLVHGHSKSNKRIDSDVMCTIMSKLQFNIVRNLYQNGLKLCSSSTRSPVKTTTSTLTPTPMKKHQAVSHYTTPYHTAQHHTTLHSTPHHTTTHHTTPHHYTPHYTTQHNTTQHYTTLQNEK